MDLVRDCLDKQLIAGKKKPVGRIDGIVMVIDGHHQPRIAAVEVGSVTQARRLHRALGRWMARLAGRWGKMRPNPYRIPWAALTPEDNDFRVDADIRDIPTLAWERWLRDRVIGRIPGA